ncbi:MAG: PAS domain S-box protein [Magnetospirillum sp. WYHS-4]
MTGDGDLRKFKTAIEQSPVSVIITDIDGRIEYVNPKFCAVTGYAAAEVLGQNPRILRSGKTSAEEYALMWRTLLAGREWAGEFLNRRKGGELYWEFATISSLRDESGAITHFVAVKEDITLRKHYEEGLRRTVDELSRSNSALEQFAYVAAHDLQEPLRAQVNFAQLVEKRYADRLDDQGRDDLRLIVQNARLMKTRVGDLLEYSRIHSGSHSQRSVDTNDLLGKLLDEMKEGVNRAGARVIVDGLPSVVGDPAQLQLVFRHLIDNALKFHHSDRPPEVRISGETIAEGFRFSVADNGIGIAPEYADRIFVMFKRLHTQQAYPGTGIGLAICKRVVERHGGRIWLEASPEGGCAFRFTLRNRPAEG